MKKTNPFILLVGLIILTSFENKAPNYEQIVFDYFISDILKSDFTGVKSFEFKGRTETSYSLLEKSEFCLPPEEKLGSLLMKAVKGLKRNDKEIDFRKNDTLTILDFQKKSTSYQLFLYPSLHIADNYYVFLLFQKHNEQSVKYVFELSREGDISRSCKTG